MKKLLLSGVVIIAFIAYVFYERTGASQLVAILPPTPSTGASPITPTQPQTGIGMYKDGEYIGNITDAYYGKVQVKAIISSGKIADVQFLDYPKDRSTSLEISSQAMPLLKSEAIQAQSAQVNGVSGATQTSEAFIRSLISALAQAQS